MPKSDIFKKILSPEELVKYMKEHCYEANQDAAADGPKVLSLELIKGIWREKIDLKDGVLLDAAADPGDEVEREKVSSAENRKLINLAAILGQLPDIGALDKNPDQEGADAEVRKITNDASRVLDSFGGEIRQLPGFRALLLRVYLEQELNDKIGISTAEAGRDSDEYDDDFGEEEEKELSLAQQIIKLVQRNQQYLAPKEVLRVSVGGDKAEVDVCEFFYRNMGGGKMKTYYYNPKNEKIYWYGKKAGAENDTLNEFNEEVLRNILYQTKEYIYSQAELERGGAGGGGGDEEEKLSFDGDDDRSESSVSSHVSSSASSSSSVASGSNLDPIGDEEEKLSFDGDDDRSESSVSSHVSSSASSSSSVASGSNLDPIGDDESEYLADVEGIQTSGVVKDIGKRKKKVALMDRASVEKEITQVEKLSKKYDFVGSAPDGKGSVIFREGNKKKQIIAVSKSRKEFIKEHVKDPKRLSDKDEKHKHAISHAYNYAEPLGDFTFVKKDDEKYKDIWNGKKGLSEPFPELPQIDGLNAAGITINKGKYGKKDIHISILDNGQEGAVTGFKVRPYKMVDGVKKHCDFSYKITYTTGDEKPLVEIVDGRGNVANKIPDDQQKILDKFNINIGLVTVRGQVVTKKGFVVDHKNYKAKPDNSILSKEDREKIPVAAAAGGVGPGGNFVSPSKKPGSPRLSPTRVVGQDDNQVLL